MKTYESLQVLENHGHAGERFVAYLPGAGTLGADVILGFGVTEEEAMGDALDCVRKNPDLEIDTIEIEIAEVTVERCAYCQGVVARDTEHVGTDGYVKQGVPDADNCEAWDALAVEHEPGCEWVRTRAHRVDD